MKKIFLLLSLYFLLPFSTLFAGNSAPCKSDYPHWDFENKTTYQKLVKLNNFIENNKNKKLLAIFDWDGTLYNENIPVKEMNGTQYAGQPAYYIWAAANNNLFDFKLFPLFWTNDGLFNKNVITKNNFLEGHSNRNADEYSKFTQTPLFTAGMSRRELEKTVYSYIKDYPPKKYAFLPMLDVLQKMTDEGFNVWIVTGSNQYFVGCILKYIQNNIEYRPGEKYNFSKILEPTEKSEMHIAGNSMKLMTNNRFSAVYDNRYTQNTDNKLYIVDKKGKEIAVKNIEKWENTRAIFVAGNSDGDLWNSKFILNRNTGAFGIGVNPLENSKLMNFYNKHKQQTIILNSDEL
jgi:phosphoserine phosphatase